MKMQTSVAPVTEETLRALIDRCNTTAEAMCYARERAEYHNWKGSTGSSYDQAVAEWHAARRAYQQALKLQMKQLRKAHKSYALSDREWLIVLTLAVIASVLITALTHLSLAGGVR